MTTWRVRASRRVEHWFNADIHFVVEAPDAETARAIVEADPEVQAWETKPMTPEMAERLQQHKADCEAWVERNRTGESNLGRKVRGF